MNVLEIRYSQLCNSRREGKGFLVISILFSLVLKHTNILSSVNVDQVSPG